MSGFVAWIMAHWQELVGVVAALLSLASLITALTPTPKDDEVVRKILAWLSFLQPRTSSGTVKLPASSPGEDLFGRLDSSDEDEPPAPRKLGF